MWSPASNKGPPGGAAPAAHARRLTALALAGLVPMALAACSSEPARTAPRPAPPLAQPAAHATAAPPAVTAGAASATAAAAAPAAAVRPQVLPAARADFDRAVNYMRAGNARARERQPGRRRAYERQPGRRRAYERQPGRRGAHGSPGRAGIRAARGACAGLATRPG